MSSITAVPLRPIAKGSLTKLWLGIALLVIAAAALAWFGTKAHAANKDGTTAQFLAWNAQQDGVITTASGLQYQVLAPGSGPTPTDEDVATVGYKGELRDGSVFDQQPSVPLPIAQMVPGFSEALKLMPKGAKYRIWLPPALGYGSKPQPNSPIPPDSVLIFEVSMLQFDNMAALQRQMMMGGGAGAGGGQGDPHGGGH